MVYVCVCVCVCVCACTCEYNLSFHDGTKQCNNHSQERMNCLCVFQKLDMWKIGAHFIESHLCMLQINHCRQGFMVHKPSEPGA